MNDVSKGVEPEQANPEQVVSEDVSEKKPEKEDNVIIPSQQAYPRASMSKHVAEMQ